MTFYIDKLSTSNTDGIKLALLAMIGFGVGEIIGSIIFGKI